MGTESITVGSIILQFASDLLKAYPPFVNFFENKEQDPGGGQKEPKVPRLLEEVREKTGMFTSKSN